VHYEVLGRGRPVIFLHGWVGSWRYWIASMQVTSTSYRAYALDLWGFGETARNALNYSLEQQSSLLDRFLMEMGIGKIALVGHGLGALVGMTFATRFPKSVDRVMAVSCPLSYEAVHTRLRTAPPVELSDWLSSRTPEAITALSDASKADLQAISASMVGLQANNLFSGFRDLNIPCLLVYGEKDPAITIPSEDFSLSTMTHQVVLEGSGHFPMMDETVKFNRLLTDFLALEQGLSPRELQMKEEWRRRVR
jgi:pimeloyl-ACP methyl ester carboxylesterase